MISQEKLSFKLPGKDIRPKTTRDKILWAIIHHLKYNYREDISTTKIAAFDFIPNKNLYIFVGFGGGVWKGNRWKRKMKSFKRLFMTIHRVDKMIDESFNPIIKYYGRSV